VRKIAFFSLLIASLCILINCETTDNPRSGGLFSYNPKAYEKRLDERQKRLDELENQQAMEKQASEQLEKEIVQKKSEKDVLNKKISALEKDMTWLKKRIQNANTETKQEEKELSEIRVKMKTIEKELLEIKSTTSEDIQSQKKEIQRLERTIDELLKEAEALSKM